MQKDINYYTIPKKWKWIPFRLWKLFHKPNIQFFDCQIQSMNENYFKTEDNGIIEIPISMRYQVEKKNDE